MCYIINIENTHDLGMYYYTCMYYDHASKLLKNSTMIHVKLGMFKRSYIIKSRQGRHVIENRKLFSCKFT